MNDMNDERREFELLEAKSENGIVTGLGNTIFEVDRYGDIVIGYEGLDEMVRDGFIADSHGLDSGNGDMGNYTYKGMAGIITAARQTEKGLEMSWQFDPSDSSQDLRKKVEFRIDNQKTVATSIGFKAIDPVIIYRSQYKTLLPNYIPSSKLAKVLKDAEKFTSVRVLKTRPHELSLAPRPVNEGSVMNQYKNMKTESKIEFTKDEFKGEFLGVQIVDSITLAAIERLLWRMQSKISNLLMPWDDSVEEDATAEALTVNGIVDETMNLVKAVYAKMSELELTDIAIEAKGMFSDSLLEFKSKNVVTNGEKLVSAFEDWKTKAEKFAEYRKGEMDKEFKAGKKHSGKTEKQLSDIQDIAKTIKSGGHSIYKSIEDMLAMPEDEGKSLQTELEMNLLMEEFNREELHTN